MPRLLLSLALLLGSSTWLACAPAPPDPPPHVVLLSIDSLQTDRLRLYAPEDGAPTPHLEGLAERGVRYANAWAASPWTAPSIVSILTGLHPPSHGVAVRDDTTPAALPSLPRILEARGYRLGNFTFFSQISYFRNLGFPEAPDELGHDSVAESFARWLDGAEDPGRPFFAWLHLLEPHLPYGATGYQATEVTVPGSSGLEAAQLEAIVPVGTATFEPGDRERLLALYDRDVAAMDAHVGRIVRVLEDRGMLERTLFVVVADHGEELLEDGWIGHASTAIEAKLLRETLHVPMILAGPGVPEGRVETDLVQPVDAFPTLLRVLGAEIPELVDGVPLPGFARFWDGDRDLAFFDSSVGGNMTPTERRDARLQGVTDGDCLLASQVEPGVEEKVTVRPVGAVLEADCMARQARLAEALDQWREDQGTQRLELLSREGEAGGPSTTEADGWVEAISVDRPASEATLTWEGTRGQLVLAWSGPGDEYWIEYAVGSGALAAEGMFHVAQQRIVFGPFPQGFWNDLASYSPFRFRVLDADNQARSPWVEFRVREVP